MLYNPLLNKAVCKLTTRGALRYVHQDPNGGEFVASDGIVMLVENTGTPFLTAFWDTYTLSPVDCADKYPDWRKVLSDGLKTAKKPYKADRIAIQEGFAVVGGLYTSAVKYQLVRDFIGSDIVINIPESVSYPIYFRNADKSRQALIMPYNVRKGTKWEVLNASGEVVYTTNDIREAEMFNLTVRVA